MPTLFDGDISASDEELKVNEGYANNYNNWRQKEELNKLKTRYGDSNIDLDKPDDDSDSSSDEEEDETGPTKEFDKEFYKALAILKKKDPSIYNGETAFFDKTNIKSDAQNGDSEERPKSKSKKEKALSLRDYERKIILEREGKYSDSEDEEKYQKNGNASSEPTYVEEQRRLKESFKSVLLDENQEEDTDFLKLKIMSKDDKQQEEEDYKQWLKGQHAEIDEKEQEELKPLRDFWTDPNLDPNEKFLRDYVLNNKYMDDDSTNVDIDYDHMIHDSDENLSEDERNIEKQEEFEHKYNFRFEEPDQDFIKRYPRTMENSMRKKDTRRSQKRAELKKRKEEDKLRKKEELKQLKALKRKEIEEKLDKLKEITGNTDINFDDAFLEGDFDPNEHDRKMKEYFNEQYYSVAEGDVKPEFPEIDDELEIETNWDNYDPNEEADYDDDNKAPHCEDPEFNMDADYDGSRNAESEIIESTRKRKRRRRSKFAELIAQKKPKFDPKQHPSYQEYFDQYYSLDYEDMIGDLPCRFKYRKVVPNDYGLTVEEILAADDRELNKWCSLKKALQYKPEHVELNDVRMYKNKVQNEALKRRILKSLYAPPDTEEHVEDVASEVKNEDSKKKTKKKKIKLNKKDNGTVSEQERATVVDSQDIEESRNSSLTGSQSNDGKNIEIAQAVNTTDTTSKKKKRKKNSLASQNDPVQSKKQKTRESGVRSDKPTAIDREECKSNDGTPARKKQGDKLESRWKDKAKKGKTKRNKGGKRNQLSKDAERVVSIDAERLKTYGINPKKLKNKLLYGKSKE